jgi:hypothetical protein
MAGHSAQVPSDLGWQRRPLMTCAGGAFAGRAASAGSAVVGAVVGTAGLRGGLPAAGTAGAAARDGCGTADREPGGELDGEGGEEADGEPAGSAGGIGSVSSGAPRR